VAWRRSYGCGATSEAASAAENAATLALWKISRYDRPVKMPPLGPVKIRPPLAGGKLAMCSVRSLTRCGCSGTGRVSPGARCLSSRGWRALPLSVQWAPLRGSVLLQLSSQFQGRASGAPRPGPAVRCGSCVEDERGRTSRAGMDSDGCVRCRQTRAGGRRQAPPLPSPSVPPVAAACRRPGANLTRRAAWPMRVRTRASCKT
jgi:hypothetical protein